MASYTQQLDDKDVSGEDQTSISTLSPLANLDDDFEYVFRYDDRVTRFNLLDLPPEIWSRICELVVVKLRPIYVTEHFTSTRLGPRLRQPPLTRTCRPLRKEALRMFYHENELRAVMNFDYNPSSWLSSIGAENLLAMGSIHCSYSLTVRAFRNHIAEQIEGMRKKLGLCIDLEDLGPFEAHGDSRGLACRHTFGKSKQETSGEAVAQCETVHSDDALQES